METETTALARQRKATCPGERKRADTDLDFFPWFSVVFLKSLSAVSRLVEDPLESPLQNWGW